MIKLKVDKVVKQQEIEIPTPYYAKNYSATSRSYYKITEDKIIHLDKFTNDTGTETEYTFSCNTKPNFEIEYYKRLLTNHIHKSSEEEFCKMYEEAIDFIEKNFEPKIGE